MNRPYLLAGLLVLQGCAAVGEPRYPASIAPTPESSNRQVQIRNNDDHAYANVCHLTIHRRWIGIISRRGKFGSAVLYRGRYLLTAAHNLYNPWYNPVVRVDVRCGTLNAEVSPPDQTVAGRQGRTARGYRWGLFNRDQFQHDFAVLRLARPMTSPRPVSLRVEPTTQGTEVELAGYPGGDISNARLLYAGTGRVIGSDRNVISYNLETAKGNSGGPVWVRRGETLQLVGIHVTGSGARAVNESFVAEVDRMIAELER